MSYPNLTPKSQTSAIVLPVTGNIDNVPAQLPFGVYAADNDFLTMGDLKEESFMDAWNSQKFMALRQAHLNKDITGTACENCVAYA